MYVGGTGDSQIIELNVLQINSTNTEFTVRIATISDFQGDRHLNLPE